MPVGLFPKNRPENCPNLKNYFLSLIDGNKKQQWNEFVFFLIFNVNIFTSIGRTRAAGTAIPRRLSTFSCRGSSNSTNTGPKSGASWWGKTACATHRVDRSPGETRLEKKENNTEPLIRTRVIAEPRRRWMQRPFKTHTPVQIALMAASLVLWMHGWMKATEWSVKHGPDGHGAVLLIITNIPAHVSSWRTCRGWWDRASRRNSSRPVRWLRFSRRPPRAWVFPPRVPPWRVWRPCPSLRGSRSRTLVEIERMPQIPRSAPSILEKNVHKGWILTTQKS